MTRIIAGKYKGRQLAVPEGLSIRPTSEKMRGRIFSMLVHPRFPDMLGANVADIFSGTGGLGLEALSRGATAVTFVDNSPESLKFLQANIKKVDVVKDTTVIATRATALPRAKAPFDIIFMDPPYSKGLVTPTLNSILENDWLAKDGVIICELHKSDPLEIPDGLQIIDDRKQGKQRILFISF